MKRLIFLLTLCVLFIASGVQARTFHFGGSADVDKVGNCESGDCLDGSSDGGTSISLYDGDSNKLTLSVGNLSADLAFAFPITWTTAILGYVDPTSSIQDQLDARCLESVLGETIGAGLLKDGTVLKVSTILQEYHAVNPTAAGLTLLDDADASAQRTTLSLVPGTNVQAYDADTMKLDTAGNISANFEVQDNVHFSWGNDDDFSWGYNSTSGNYELVNASDTLLFWIETDGSANSASVASPASKLYDSGATGTDRADKFVAGWYGQITTPTEDGEIGDFRLTSIGTATAGTEYTNIWFDADAQALYLGIMTNVDAPGDVANHEHLKLDFDTDTDGEVEISAGAGGTNVITANGITIAALNAPVVVTENTTLTNKQVHGRYIFVTAACTVTLPSIAAAGVGSSVLVFVKDAAEQVIVDSNGLDTITLRAGTAIVAGYSIDIPAGASHYVILHALDADSWYIIGESDTCTDGGAS